jgi:hypothetical protein
MKDTARYRSFVQPVADLITISYELHENLTKYNRTYRRVTHIDESGKLYHKINDLLREPFVYKEDSFTNKYALSFSLSFGQTWDRFTAQFPEEHPDEELTVESARLGEGIEQIITQPFVIATMKQARANLRESRLYENRPPTVTDTVIRGMNTGCLTAMRNCIREALLTGSEISFDPVAYSYQQSKTAMSRLDIVNAPIERAGSEEKLRIYPNILTEQQLAEQGMGQTTGCAGSFEPSVECKTFMAQYGGNDANSSVVERVATMVRRDVKGCLIPWWRKNRRQAREQIDLDSVLWLDVLASANR